MLFLRGFLKLSNNEDNSIARCINKLGRAPLKRTCPRTADARNSFLWPHILTVTLILGHAPVSFSDILYLSDGNILVVERAWQEGDQVKYQTSQGVKTMPAVAVQRIQPQKPLASPGAEVKRYGIGVEAGDPVPGANRSPVALLLNVTSQDVSEGIIVRLKENLKNDPNDLRSKRSLIEALNSYASLQLLKGDASGAKSSLQQALGYDKKSSTTLLNLAVLLYHTAEYRNAEDVLSEVIQEDSRNQYGRYLLGEVYYAQDKVSEAITAWKAALQLGEDPIISNRLKKAEEEVGTHSELGALHSAHFILRYDRKVSDYRLGQEILDSLERAYRQLTYDLTAEAPATVTVILYADQTYFDITRAPRWSGALFDGKIRIPIKGLSSVTPQLQGILSHELTHSFVNWVGRGNCPVWFNEGLAQLQEGKSAAGYKQILSQLLTQNQLVPWGSLKDSFVGLTAGEAELAYLEGLSAAEYFTTRLGKNAVRTVLELLRQNYSFESALKSVSNQSLADFEKSWRVSLVQ
jgi:tetratricopeptide (TPR) repeat protein